MRKTKYQKIKEVKEEIEVFALRLQRLESELPKDIFRQTETLFIQSYNHLSSLSAELYNKQLILDLKYRK